jgi:hypothetical protein
MSTEKITVTKEMIEAVERHHAEEDKRRAEEHSRRTRERWEQQEKDIREKVRIIIGHDISDEQFDLLTSAFREYNEEW